MSLRSTHFLSLPLALLLLGQSAARAELPLAKLDAAGIDQAKVQAIAKRMDSFVERQIISGAVTLVAKDGKIIQLEAVGKSDIDKNSPMKKDSIFAIASMTKPICGAAVAILMDEGKLSLDDAVSKYIPEFKNVRLKSGGTPKREITIRDVITHTSGLAGDQQNMGTLAETAKKLAERPLEFEPGEKWMYSPGLSVAGRVVEVASGQKFDEFLEKRIFQPLGMKDTTFNPSPAQKERIVGLYKQSDDKKTLAATSHWINDTATHREPNPSGGLFSTAADVASFYQMVLNGGELDGKRIMSEKAAKQLTTVQTNELVTGFTPGNGWGMGWCVVRKPEGVTGMLSPGSAGHGGAFGTQSWLDPQRNMVFILMIQRTGLPNADGSDMRRDLQQIGVDAVSK